MRVRSLRATPFRQRSLSPGGRCPTARSIRLLQLLDAPPCRRKSQNVRSLTATPARPLLRNATIGGRAAQGSAPLARKKYNAPQRLHHRHLPLCHEGQPVRDALLGVCVQGPPADRAVAVQLPPGFIVVPVTAHHIKEGAQVLPARLLGPVPGVVRQPLCELGACLVSQS